MGLNDVLKSVLGDEIYKDKGDSLKKELAKEMIPKAEFNDKLETIKGLESEKKLLLEEKVQLEKSVEESQNAGKSDIEKLSLNLKKLEEKLTQESELRAKAEQTLNDEKKTNSLKQILGESKMKAKYIDDYVSKFKDVPDEELKAKIEEFANDRKELFGDEKLKGDDPKGSFDENKSGFITKDEFEKMSDEQAADNFEKIQKSMEKW